MKAEENTKFTFISNMPSDTIFISIAKDKPILELKGNGEIYVKGKLIENDIEVVNGMRELINKDRVYQIDMQTDIDELVGALIHASLGNIERIDFDNYNLLIQKHTNKFNK